MSKKLLVKILLILECWFDFQPSIINLTGWFRLNADSLIESDEQVICWPFRFCLVYNKNIVSFSALKGVSGTIFDTALSMNMYFPKETPSFRFPNLNMDLSIVNILADVSPSPIELLTVKINNTRSTVFFIVFLNDCANGFPMRALWFHLISSTLLSSQQRTIYN